MSIVQYLKFRAVLKLLTTTIKLKRTRHPQLNRFLWPLPVKLLCKKKKQKQKNINSHLFFCLLLNIFGKGKKRSLFPSSQHYDLTQTCSIAVTMIHKAENCCKCILMFCFTPPQFSKDVIRVHLALLRAIEMNMVTGGSGLGKIFLEFKERSVCFCGPFSRL